tara:strand:+ start:3830 stop:4018 length:189 start_codon:yes stop_codon:yes gene_type:complete
MKVGDLVRCMTVDGKPVGLVVERFVFAMKPVNTTDIFYVLISGYEDPFPLRTSQMELVNASR